MLPPMTEKSATLDSIVQRAGDLYSLPAVAMQVLELTDNPKVDTAALKKCIENDPAMTTRILRVVNSSLFGLSREVGDLNQALAMLGIKPLKLLVLGFSLPEGLFAGRQRHQLDRYWRHTLTKAVAAREISQTLWDRPGDEAFLAGLLADIGILVLLNDLGEAYSRFLERVEQERADLEILETKALGFSHTIVSAQVLDHWGLPKALVEAIAVPKSIMRLTSLSPAQAALPQILHMAELLTQVVAQDRLRLLPELLEAGDSYCGMTRDGLTALVETLPEKIEQLADVLALDLPARLDYRDVLARAHKQLAEVAFHAATDLYQRQQADEQPYQRLLEETRSLADEAELVTRKVQRAATAVVPAPQSAVAAAAQNVAIEPASSTAVLSPHAPEHDPGLSGRVRQAVADCRMRRCELSLLLVEIDRFEEWLAARGPQGAELLVRLLHAACQSVDQADKTVLQTGEAHFSLLLPECDRRVAVQFGRELVHRMRDLSRACGTSSTPKITLSVGAATVAIPPKNFPPDDLIESAERCLYGAQSCGGNSVKSIEIY
jgi:HD-like signal output (HDOD) protein/GGDEF domain-containing protein